MISALILAIFAWQGVPSRGREVEIEQTISSMSVKWGVPADVLTWTSFFESSWRQDSVGKRGELGPVQIMPNGPIARKCRSIGLDVAQWDCAAFTVAEEWRECGGIWECFWRTHACGSIRGDCGKKTSGVREHIRKKIGW